MRAVASVGVLGDEPVALGLGEPNHEPGERVASRSMVLGQLTQGLHAQRLRLQRREQSLLAAIGLTRLAAIVRSLGPLLLQTTEG